MYKRSKDLQPTLRDLLTPLNHLFHISDMHTHYPPYVINEIAEIKVSYHPFYNIPERVTINSTYDALEIFWKYRDHKTINYCEMCYVIFTNNSREVIGIYNFSKGTDTKTTFSCKQIIAIALKVNAA